MQRRTLIFGLVAIAFATPLRAAGPVDALLETLRGEGFEPLDVSTTLLGRTRILASDRHYEREIVVNPHTGEILRDYRVPIASAGGSGTSGSGSSGSGSGSSGSGSSGSGSGTSGDDDDDDDNDDDNDDDSDDSGDDSGGQGRGRGRGGDDE